MYSPGKALAVYLRAAGAGWVAEAAAGGWVAAGQARRQGVARALRRAGVCRMCVQPQPRQPPAPPPRTHEMSMQVLPTAPSPTTTAAGRKGEREAGGRVSRAARMGECAHAEKRAPTLDVVHGGEGRGSFFGAPTRRVWPAGLQCGAASNSPCCCQCWPVACSPREMGRDREPRDEWRADSSEKRARVRLGGDLSRAGRGRGGCCVGCVAAVGRLHEPAGRRPPRSEAPLRVGLRRPRPCGGRGAAKEATAGRWPQPAQPAQHSPDPGHKRVEAPPEPDQPRPQSNRAPARFRAPGYRRLPPPLAHSSEYATASLPGPATATPRPRGGGTAGITWGAQTLAFERERDMPEHAQRLYYRLPPCTTARSPT